MPGTLMGVHRFGTSRFQWIPPGSSIRAVTKEGASRLMRGAIGSGRLAKGGELGTSRSTRDQPGTGR